MQEMLDRALALPSEDERQGGLAALVVWLRFSAARLLTWNRNYNIKPREISAAQVGLLTHNFAQIQQYWATVSQNWNRK